MSDKDFAALAAVMEQVNNECNTPELAKQQLQAEGILDHDGLLAEPYRPTICS